MLTLNGVASAVLALFVSPLATQNQPVYYFCTAESVEYRSAYVSHTFQAPLNRYDDIKRAWIDRLNHLITAQVGQYDLSSVGCSWNADHVVITNQKNEWVQGKVRAEYRFLDGDWLWAP